MTTSSIKIQLHCACIAFLLLFPFLLSAQQENEEHPSHDISKAQNHLQTPHAPDVYPLILEDGDKLRQITIMDHEVLTVSTVLKNISDKPVVIPRLLTSCSCIKPEKYKDLSLKPGEKMTLRFSIDGNHLKLDQARDFMQKFYVYPDGFPPAYAELSGKSKRMFSFEPAQILDLGEFIGDVLTWKRTLKLTTKFEQDNVNIKPISESRFFNISVTKSAPQTFTIDITPKNPFPISGIEETIGLAVEGIPNYAPIPFLIKGSPQGKKLVLASQCHIHKRDKVIPDSPIEFDVPMTLRALLPKPPEQGGFSSRRRTSKAAGASMPVSKEEEEARPLNKLETWQTIAKDLSVKKLPESVKVDFIPAANGIKAHFTVPPAFHKSKDFFSCIFFQKDTIITYFDFYIK